MLTLFIGLYTLPKLLLSLLQIGHVRAAMQKPAEILPHDAYLKAGLYAIAKEKLAIGETLLEGILFIFWILFGLAWLDAQLAAFSLPSWLVAPAFVLSLLIFQALISLPFGAYRTLIMDKKFGFSQGGVSLFALDQVKGLLLTLVFGLPIIWGLAKIIEGIALWWLYGFLFFMVLILMVNLLYPTLIAPIFNKFTPLEDPALKHDIEQLMQKAGFKSSGVFVMDASRRDGRLNAYFGGLGSSKRVVLFDTLLNKVSTSQLLAILGHELGHFRHGDLYKNLAFMTLLIFLLFFFVGHLPDILFLAASIERSPQTIISFLILLASPLGFWLMPLFGLLSRHNEYAADSFGASLQSREDLREALVVLVNENRSFPRSHPLYIFFYYTHPPLLERLKALGYRDS